MFTGFHRTLRFRTLRLPTLFTAFVRLPSPFCYGAYALILDVVDVAICYLFVVHDFRFVPRYYVLVAGYIPHDVVVSPFRRVIDYVSLVDFRSVDVPTFTFTPTLTFIYRTNAYTSHVTVHTPSHLGPLTPRCSHATYPLILVRVPCTRWLIYTRSTQTPPFTVGRSSLRSRSCWIYVVGYLRSFTYPRFVRLQFTHTPRIHHIHAFTVTTILRLRVHRSLRSPRVSVHRSRVTVRLLFLFPACDSHLLVTVDCVLHSLPACCFAYLTRSRLFTSLPTPASSA